MRIQIYRKTILTDPQSGFSKGLTASDYRKGIQDYFPKLAYESSGTDRFGIDILFSIEGRKNKHHPKTDIDNLIKPIIDAGTYSGMMIAKLMN